MVPVPELACPLCGDTIGVYEPLLWVHPDGRAEPCGFLTVRDRIAGDEQPPVYHEACYERELLA